jgi:hypothetical protein
MKHARFAASAALLALALSQPACSTATASSKDLMPDNYAETGMLNPVVVTADRRDSVVDEVVVTALRVEVEETTVRLVLPGQPEIEISDLSPSADPVN